MTEKKGVAGVLFEMMTAGAKAMTRELTRSGKDNTGKLGRSFQPAVDVKTLFEYDAVITTDAHYFDFVDQGVRGHGRGKSPANKPMKSPRSPYQFKIGPPANVFKKWARTKMVKYEKGAEYAMAKSAGRYGLSGAHYIDKGVEAIETMLPDLEEAIARQIDEQIENVVGSGLY